MNSSGIFSTVHGPKLGEFQVGYKERMDRMPMDLDSWCLNMPAPDTDQAATLGKMARMTWDVKLFKVGDIK